MREGWEYKKLGEVASYINGYAFKPNQWKEKGTPIIRIQNLNNPKAPYNYYDGELSDRVKVVDGDLLISWSASLGAYIWKGRDAFLNQHIFKVCFDKLDIDKMFLKYAVTSKLETMIGQVHGATMKHIVKKDFDNTRIPFPPKNTQLAIVAELDQINDLIRLKKEQLKEYDNLAQSIFYDMFGDPVENEKGWKVKKLGEVGEIVTGSTPSTTDNTNWNGEINWVTPAELDNQLFFGATQRRLTEKGAKGLTLMPVGTVLLSSRAPIGKIAITTQPMCCNQGFKNIICGKLLNNIFLYYYLLTTLENIKALGCGATFKEVSKKAIHSYETILPPLPLQQEFSSRIEQIEKLKTEVQKTITDLETLLAARMQHWFE